MAAGAAGRPVAGRVPRGQRGPPGTSAAIYVAFRGNTESLLPLYAVGVFLAFTLSQTGMIMHWQRHRDQPHWRRSLAFNATGADPRTIESTRPRALVLADPRDGRLPLDLSIG